jgi:hypothetical protein
MTGEAASTPKGLHITSDTRPDPLGELSAQGVAVRLDDLSGELLASGELQSLITGRHVVGVTTNPTIFASALEKGDRYNGRLRDLAELGASTETAIFTSSLTTPAMPPPPRTWPGPCGPQ